MKTQRVFLRISKANCSLSKTKHAEWYCIEYPAFNTMTDVELGVLRAKSMLALHKAADRVFYIDSAPRRTYMDIKTDGLFEYPTPTKLRDMKGYTPEDLASFLDIKPLETLIGN